MAPLVGRAKDLLNCAMSYISKSPGRYHAKT